MDTKTQELADSDDKNAQAKEVVADSKQVKVEDEAVGGA